MAISGKVGLSFGFVHTVSGIIILGIDLLLKEKIGFGTILGAILVGNYVLVGFRISIPFPSAAISV